MGFFGSLFGDDQADAIRTGMHRASKLYNKGRDTARPLIEGGYDQALGYVEPYVEGGQAGQDFYDDLLGLNGETARSEAQRLVMSDPAFTGQLGQQQNALMRGLNAQGRSASGAGMLAAERVFQQNYGDILNRYANRGNQGLDAARLGGGLAVGRGSDLANLEFGTNQLLANNQIGGTNAIASAKNAGVNNLLNIAGLGIKAKDAGLF